MQKMLDAGVSTRRGATNVHREAAYPEGSWRAGSGLPQSEDAQETAIAPPLYHPLAEDEQDRAIEAPGAAVRSICPSPPPRSTKRATCPRSTTASARRS